jgi:hypothetical protein
MAAMLSLILGIFAPAAHATPTDGDVARLSAALAEHPDDPALARALARAQLDRGETDAAIATLRGFGMTHPEARPQLAQMLGRALYEKGELSTARAALEEAIAHRETDALAHFYLGLVLTKSRETEAAAAELSRAVELDASLAKSLREAAAPPSAQATSFLSRFAFAGGSGGEYDTNPRLASDEELATLPDGDTDFRWVYDAGVAVNLLRTENSAVNASYRFEESRHDDLEELDVQAHGFGLGGVLALGPRAFARLDGSATLQRLDHQKYLDAWSVGPALGYAFDGKGLLQLRGFAEQRDFADAPLLPALERDGWRYGVALQHSLPVELWAAGQLTSQLQYARTRTDADTVGFDSAFDSTFLGADLGLGIPLGLGFRMQSRLLFGYESFDEESVIAFLEDENDPPDPHPDRRRDRLLDVSLSLVRPITELIDLEVRLRETRRWSNVEVYDTDRQLIGTYLRFHFDP